MTRLGVCMVLAAMLLAIGAATAQDGSWADRVSLSGYFQTRYVDTDQSNLYDTFDLTRLYVTIKGDVDDHTTGIITFARVGPDVMPLSGGGEGGAVAVADPTHGYNIDLYNCFLDYRVGDSYAVQAGQVPTWFGLEGWEGSSVRLPFERAKIIQAGPGFFFKGAPDRGVWIRRNPQNDEPLVVLGISNGQFRNNDLDDDKNIDVHVKFDRDWGQFGASWLDGTLVTDGNASDRNALGAYVRMFPQPLGFQVEWADGELLGADRDGFYLQGMYACQDARNTVFARYEEYNADVDASNNASYDGYTIGVAHKVYDSGQITVQYTNGDWDLNGAVPGVGAEAQLGGGWSENLLGIQWQYAFR